MFTQVKLRERNHKESKQVLFMFNDNIKKY